MKLDLHCHTSEGSSCSNLATEEVVSLCQQMGMDTVAITDHHSVRGAEKLKEIGLNVITGVEVWVKDGPSKDYGEYIIFPFGDIVLEPVETYYDRPHITLSDALARGFFDPPNLVIWCHPPFDHVDWFEFCLKHLGHRVHALEVVNYASGMHSVEESMETIKTFGLEHLPLLSNSDAHHAKQFMRYYNEFHVPIHNVGDLIRAVRRKQFSMHLGE